MMHRIKTFLLGLVLAFPILTPLAVYADSATLYLSPASGSVSKGSFLTVNVRENSGGEPVNSVQANLTYPADLLDFVSISSSTAWGVVAENSGGDGSVRIARGAQPAVTGDQLVASIRFKAKTDSGTASISFASGSAVISANTNTDVKSGETGASYTLKASAPAPAEPAKDTTPPTITGKIQSTEITATTAVISWTTNEPSTSEVSYGPSDKYGIAATDSNLVTDHKITLSSPLITAGTKYHFMVKSADSSGNVVSGADATFTTVGATLEAKVVNQSNKPIRGAKVTFGDISAITDKNGKATLTNLPLGKLTGVVTYKGKQAPATVQLDTLLAKGNKPHTTTFKIETTSNTILWGIIAGLVAALICVIFYRRRGGGNSGGAPSSGNSVKKIISRAKTKIPALRGRTKKNETVVSSQPQPVPPSAPLQPTGVPPATPKIIQTNNAPPGNIISNGPETTQQQ